MKYALLISLAAGVFVANSNAQERIYRCGNEYTNTVPSAQTKGCKLMEGGNVTVVKGTRPTASSAPRSGASSAQRVDANDQKSRDSDAHLILSSELKKAEARQAELTREYNNGAPEKLTSETSNQQKYQNRVAELKASLVRNESDIAGIRREIERFGIRSAVK